MNEELFSVLVGIYCILAASAVCYLAINSNSKYFYVRNPAVNVALALCLMLLGCINVLVC